ncbi:MAG: histidine kinase [Variovorax sp.]
MREPEPANDPLDALWQPPAIIWMVLVGEGLSLVLSLASGVDGQRWRYFGFASLGTQWVLLFTLVMLYAVRRPLSRIRPVRVAYVALALLLINTWLVMGVAGFIWLGSWPMYDNGLLPIQLRATGIVLTVGLLGLAAFQNHWRARQMDLKAKQSQLEALQARIRPHFLFNTLNTGAALVHRQPEEVERLLLDLADLFRAALAGPHDISLEDELALARRYLEIEQLRFGDRLQVDWQLPREIPAVTVPALSIQPLVENAIRHGIERRAEGGQIEIAVTTTPETTIVRIINPLASGGGQNPGHHVGLNASQVRIEALTGGRGSVITQQEGKRFIATVRLPVSPG